MAIRDPFSSHDYFQEESAGGQNIDPEVPGGNSEKHLHSQTSSYKLYRGALLLCAATIKPYSSFPVRIPS
jgi:hypothetical protein